MAATYSLYNTRENPVTSNQPSKVEGVAVSGTADFYSDVFAPRTNSWGFHFQWTGTPTGTITLWRTNKPNPILTTDADWIQVTTFAPTNPAGSASKFGDEINFTNFKHYRFKYANTAGSGTLFCWASQVVQ